MDRSENQHGSKEKYHLQNEGVPLTHLAYKRSDSDKEERKPSYIGVSLAANGYRLLSRTPGELRCKGGSPNGLGKMVNGANGVDRKGQKVEYSPSSSHSRKVSNNGVTSGQLANEGSLASKNLDFTFNLPDLAYVNEQLMDGLAYKKLLNELVTFLTAHLKRMGELLHNEEESLPETTAEQMRVAFGRTELLLTKRLKQFEQQLERHLHPVPGEKPTKIDDLRGLFSLVAMQLEDISTCFERIRQSIDTNQ